MSGEASRAHAAHVLVADDDPVVRDVVRRYLERDGLRVSVAVDGDEALALAAEGVDLVVLDVMMPGTDGIEVCRRLRAEVAPHVPVVMLTALGEEDDRVLGLQVGADDYVTKPFSPRELALRVASVLRRATPATTPAPTVLRDGTLEVQPGAHRALLGARELALTSREFDLLRFFLAHPDEVYTREQLLELVWGWSFGDLSTVTVHVKRLRAKLAEGRAGGSGDNGGGDPVGTVWGVGYRWQPGTFEVTT